MTDIAFAQVRIGAYRILNNEKPSPTIKQLALRQFRNRSKRIFCVNARRFSVRR